MRIYVFKEYKFDWIPFHWFIWMENCKRNHIALNLTGNLMVSISVCWRDYQRCTNEIISVGAARRKISQNLPFLEAVTRETEGKEAPLFLTKLSIAVYGIAKTGKNSDHFLAVSVLKLSIKGDGTVKNEKFCCHFLAVVQWENCQSAACRIVKTGKIPAFSFAVRQLSTIHSVFLI